MVKTVMAMVAIMKTSIIIWKYGSDLDKGNYDTDDNYGNEKVMLQMTITMVMMLIIIIKTVLAVKVRENSKMI